VYFQSYSNTYASLKTLKEKYHEALQHKGVIGLIIGTRPDCLNHEILNYLAELSETRYLTLELGIESVYDETLQRVNRCHTFGDTLQVLEETGKRNIRTGGHFIIGLPGETREQIMNSVGIISNLNLHSVKFHQLQIFRNTPMAEEYFRHPGNFVLFEFDEYLDFMMHFLEELNPSFVIERIAGETPPVNNCGNTWNKRYDEVLRAFEHLLELHDSWQGKKYTKN
jgi:radical SAM protein (TIGR01212 family)